MARYTKDFQTNVDAQTVHSAVYQYLQNEGYEYINYDGENVFKKGSGVISNPTFFKFSYSGNMVRMETWMKYALFPGVYIGELGVTGVVGSAVKGTWKNRISYIENILVNLSVQNQYYSQNPVQDTIDYDDNETQLLNDNNSFEETCVINENKAENSSSMFCTSCGARMPAGTVFCSACGQKRQDTNAQNVAQQQAHTFYASAETQQPPTGYPVSRKEFINKYAQPSVRKDIKSIAIVCYVCAGLTFIVSCIVSPIGIIDSLILAGLALGMHLSKSRGFAIALFVFSIIETLLSLVVGSFPFWWLFAGVAALVTFNKIEKQYKLFLNR